jgi:hypothetical protein
MGADLANCPPRAWVSQKSVGLTIFSNTPAPRGTAQSANTKPVDQIRAANQFEPFRLPNCRVLCIASVDMILPHNSHHISAVLSKGRVDLVILLHVDPGLCDVGMANMTVSRQTRGSGSLVATSGLIHDAVSFPSL